MIMTLELSAADVRMLIRATENEHARIILRNIKGGRPARDEASMRLSDLNGRLCAALAIAGKAIAGRD